MSHRLQVEIYRDVSALVRTLAAAYWAVAVVRGAPRALVDLCETAHHLVEPLADYETPARAAGWLPEPGDTLGRVYLDTTARDGEDESYYHAADWQEACARLRLDPEWHKAESFWSVSEWLAERLEEHNEHVGHIAGLLVWARIDAGPLAADEILRSIARSTTNYYPAQGDHQ